MTNLLLSDASAFEETTELWRETPNDLFGAAELTRTLATRAGKFDSAEHRCVTQRTKPPTPAFSGLDSLGLDPFSINNLIRQGGLSFVIIL
jgi:hypothetical protein